MHKSYYIVASVGVAAGLAHRPLPMDWQSVAVFVIGVSVGVLCHAAFLEGKK